MLLTHLTEFIAQSRPTGAIMREKRTAQNSLFDIFAGHQIGRDLKAMSAWLGGLEAPILGLVVDDLGDDGVR